jgi:hypothetical protein
MSNNIASENNTINSVAIHPTSSQIILLPKRINDALNILATSQPPYKLDGMRLKIDEAKIVCVLLKSRFNLSLQPYDIKNTDGVWKSCDENNIPYTQKATKELIVKLSKEQSVDFRSLEGFKKILKYLNIKTFRTYEINDNKTKLVGLVDLYSSSPSAPVLELINNDPDFINIKNYGITPADFPEAPNNYWHDKLGTPTTEAHKQFNRFVENVISKYNWSYNDPSDIQALLKLCSKISERKSALNFWGTSVETVILNGFSHNVSLALKYYILENRSWDMPTKEFLISTLSYS